MEYLVYPALIFLVTLLTLTILMNYAWYAFENHERRKRYNFAAEPPRIVWLLRLAVILGVAFVGFLIAGDYGLFAGLFALAILGEGLNSRLKHEPFEVRLASGTDRPTRLAASQPATRRNVVGGVVKRPLS